jgi:hypothetical protein
MELERAADVYRRFSAQAVEDIDAARSAIYDE